MFYLKEEELEKILKDDGINIKDTRILNKSSGQKKVYFIKVDNKNYVCKVIDVTPYDTYENHNITEKSDFKEIDQSIRQEMIDEINTKSKRTITEIKMSKSCNILPKICFYTEIQKKLIRNYYHIIYYIEERYKGTPLNYKDEYTVEEILNFIKQMLINIKDMSNSGYIHRDLKPDNIIFDSDTKIYKVIDGGFGKNMQNNDGNTVFSHNYLGTHGYLAPEQENFPPDYKWNFQTDLYPIGIIAMEMFLPNERHKYTTLRNLDEMYAIWKETFGSESIEIEIFRKLIVKLSAEQRINRFSKIDKALETVNSFIKEIEEAK